MPQVLILLFEDIIEATNVVDHDLGVMGVDSSRCILFNSRVPTRDLCLPILSTESNKSRRCGPEVENKKAGERRTRCKKTVVKIIIKLTRALRRRPAWAAKQDSGLEQRMRNCRKKI